MMANSVFRAAKALMTLQVDSSAQETKGELPRMTNKPFFARPAT